MLLDSISYLTIDPRTINRPWQGSFLSLNGESLHLEGRNQRCRGRTVLTRTSAETYRGKIALNPKGVSFFIVNAGPGSANGFSDALSEAAFVLVNFTR